MREESLVPATTPASKLQKDASGDVLTAATVTAALPTDTAETTAGAIAHSSSHAGRLASSLG